jgi:hypothetical protein
MISLTIAQELLRVPREETAYGVKVARGLLDVGHYTLLVVYHLLSRLPRRFC